MNTPDVSISSDVTSRWSTLCGEFPKGEIKYFCQMSIVLTVVIACIVNLSLSNSDSALWASLLSGCVGYVLPAPKIKKRKHERLLSDPPQQQLDEILQR